MPGSIQELGPAAMIATGGNGGINGHLTALGHEPHRYAWMSDLDGDTIGLRSYS